MSCPQPTSKDHLAEEQAPPNGTTIGGFRVERTIGAGSMSVVYEAIDSKSGIRVALKVLRESRRLDPEALERFRREAEILAAIDHPGIVRIVGVGLEPNDRPWIAMELLKGETLADRVRRDGPIAAVDLVPILAAVCDALSEAHANGVVHRDLKPENVFLPTAGQPAKLIDFGLSLAVSRKRLTKAGSLVGTPRYMAPEQITEPQVADHRVDVYAIGVIAYEALTGKSPFAASDQGQLLGAILQHRNRPILEVLPSLPGATAAAIHRAMDHRLARFQSPRELAEAFAASLGISLKAGRSTMTENDLMNGLDPDDERKSEPGAEPLNPEAFISSSSAAVRSLTPPRPSDWPNSTLPPPRPSQIARPPSDAPLSDHAPKIDSGSPTGVVLAIVLMLLVGGGTVLWFFIQ